MKRDAQSEVEVHVMSDYSIVDLYQDRRLLQMNTPLWFEGNDNVVTGLESATYSSRRQMLYQTVQLCTNPIVYIQWVEN